MININTTSFTADAKQYRCKACKVERRFRRKDNLIRHIRNTHRDLEPEMASVWNQAPIADACFEVSAIATSAAFTYPPLGVSSISDSSTKLATANTAILLFLKLNI